MISFNYYVMMMMMGNDSDGSDDNDDDDDRAVIERRGRGFSPAAKNVALGYFHRKMEEK